GRGLLPSSRSLRCSGRLIFHCFEDAPLGGCTRNGACSMPMTRPSFAGTLLTMTQAIGMDQVGRLETMRGPHRPARSRVPSPQLATEGAHGRLSRTASQRQVALDPL